jgi:hypothetical protein
MTEFATDPNGNPLPPGSDPNITTDTTTSLGTVGEIGGRFVDIITGPSGANDQDLEQSKYDFNYRVFPEDLTLSDSAHYMVININVPTTRSGQNRSAFSPGELLSGDFSKVDNLRFSPAFAPRTDTPQKEFLSIPRNTRRIAQSIALHMANGGLVYTEDNKYEEASLTSMAGSIVGAAGSLPGRFGGAADVVGRIGQAVTGGSRLVGYPVNPRVEVLFATRPQRQWMFEVFLAPRSVDEALTVKEIIRLLRYHAAPELEGGGFFFIPPAEFDITFYRQGVENRNLPRINTCVLEKIDIDYAPQGVYSTFRDGTPVAIRLSMGFREIEIVHKLRVLQGF